MQTALFVFILSISTLNISTNAIVRFSKKIVPLYYLCLIIYFLAFVFGKSFEYLWILTVCFSLQYFVILTSGRPLKVILLAVAIFLIAQERTSALVTLIIYFFYKVAFLKKKSVFILFYYILGTIMSVFPFVYTYLAVSGGGDSEFNNLIFETTGKNFFSGRQGIWQVIILNFAESPYAGYGLGNTILLDNGIEVSTHNLYLFLALQGGGISILLFLLFMMTLWWRYYQFYDNKIVRLSIAYFVGILISAGFGLILLANFLSYSIYLWTIIGIGIVACNNLINKAETR